MQGRGGLQGRTSGLCRDAGQGCELQGMRGMQNKAAEQHSRTDP